MSFGGDLRTFDLFDTLQWIQGRKRTGVLQLSRRSTRKSFGFRGGLLCASSSNDPRETLGQRLVRERLISEEVLFRTLLRQEKEPGRRLGELLVDEGLLTLEQVTVCLRATTEEQLYDVFLWPDGRFDFDDSRPPASSPGEFALELRPLLDEGRHRRDLWGRLRQRFPSSELTLKLLADPVSVSDPALRQVVDLAAWGKTIAGISLETRRSEFEAMLLVGELCDRGVLAADRVDEGSAVSDPVGAIVALLAGAKARLAEGRFDAAIEGYERVLAIDPLNQAAKKGVVAVSEARERARTASRVPLDKVPALRLTALALAQQRFTPEEGFVLSRINGQWDIRSILKLCPMPDEDALLIFARLLDRQVIELR
jgi:hypothetical protein